MRSSLRSGLLATICAGSMLLSGCGGESKRENIVYLTQDRTGWKTGEYPLDVSNYMHCNSISEVLDINSVLICDVARGEPMEFQSPKGSIYLVSDVAIGGLMGSNIDIDKSEARRILKIAKNNPNNGGFMPQFVYKISERNDGIVSFTNSRGVRRYGVGVKIAGNIKEREVTIVPIFNVVYLGKGKNDSEVSEKKINFCGPIKKLSR